MWLQKIITHIIFPPILPCSFRAGKSMFQLQRILAFGWEGLLHILLPRTCFACGVDLPFRFPHPLCAGCLAQIRRPGPLICMRCGTVLPAGGAHCPRCRGSKGKQFKCSVIRSACLFGPQTQALIFSWGGAPSRGDRRGWDGRGTPACSPV